MEHLILKIY